MLTGAVAGAERSGRGRVGAAVGADAVVADAVVADAVVAGAEAVGAVSVPGVPAVAGRPPIRRARRAAAAFPDVVRPGAGDSCFSSVIRSPRRW
jgi:hypothetical protein